MSFLLDTHTFVWFIGGSPKVSPDARKLIENNPGELYLSVVSIWEIAIKVSTGKLTLHDTFTSVFPPLLISNGIQIINIKYDHAALVAKLPYHHRDPFDRMLIAQAMVEQMSIISIDSSFDAYPITHL